MGQNSSTDKASRSRQASQTGSSDAGWKFRLPYVLQTTLGKGKNGVVYVAELAGGDVGAAGGGSRNIVVKKVPLSHKKRRSKQQVYGLRDEINALANLKHENLVCYFGWNIEPANEETEQQTEYFRIFMEYCPGGTLQQRAQKGLRYLQLRDCVRQILEGLAYLHSAGIVHGDLTTSSVFLTDRAHLHLKIGGFGKPHIPDNTVKKPRTSSFEAHIAPETDDRKTGTRGDPKSDIWNVAFILIELLHEGEREEFNSTDELLELISGSLDSIIMWFLGADALLGNAHLAYFAQNRKVIECIRFLKACLQRDPAARPSASELLKSPHISEDLNEAEVRPEEDVLRQFTVSHHMTEWLYQAVDNVTGGKVILTKRVVELANWMDEFVAIATVVAFHNELKVMSPHPQMIMRTDCWACRKEPSAAFVETMTVYSRWDYNAPCILLDQVIVNGDGRFRIERIQSYTNQLLAMMQPIWSGIETCPLGANVIVLDLCSTYLLLNENRTKILMLPFLFPEVISNNELRQWFIATNIWDLGILILNMLTGRLLLESREAGSFSPLIPDGLDDNTEDFLKHCFSCFTPHTPAAASWIREPGVLTWPIDQLIGHPFLMSSH